MNRCKQTAMLYNIRRAVPRLPPNQQPRGGADYIISNLIREGYKGIRKIAKSLGISKKIPRVGAHLSGARWRHKPARKVVVR